MNEATERLKHLYGEPATSEQINLYFNTLIRTYIEIAEKHPPKTIKKLPWYSRRPLNFIFYSNNTTVCFTLIGNTNSEGAEQVDNVTEMTNCLHNGFTFITSGTSFNGQKLYSIETAIREAVTRVRVELKEIGISSIQSKLDTAGEELKKRKPSIDKLKNNYDSLCRSIQLFNSESQFNQDGNLDPKNISPFKKLDMCPLIDAYVVRLDSIEKNYKNLSHDFKLFSEDFNSFKSNTNDSFKILRKNKSVGETKKVNTWLIVGIIASFALGLVNIIIKIIQKV